MNAERIIHIIAGTFVLLSLPLGAKNMPVRILSQFCTKDDAC